MNYQDEVSTRLNASCPNPQCVLNGPHPLHRNSQGNQWIPTGREGMQPICDVTGCILLTHANGAHQNKDGELFAASAPVTLVTPTVRGVDAVTALRNVAANLSTSAVRSKEHAERCPACGRTSAEMDHNSPGCLNVWHARDRARIASQTEPERAPHSEHYAAMPLEPIDVIDAWGLGFNLGCVVKYLARPKGQTIADLEKAVWYLQRELAKRRNGAL